MDASLCILEANVRNSLYLNKHFANLRCYFFQLASIPGLEIDRVTEYQPVVQTAASAQPSETVSSQNEVKPVQAADLQPEDSNATVTTTSPEVTADDNTEPDPNYTKFFKMVQFGVPPQAVKLKMQSEGLNPDFLE